MGFIEPRASLDVVTPKVVGITSRGRGRRGYGSDTGWGRSLTRRGESKPRETTVQTQKRESDSRRSPVSDTEST